jgi:UDP-N-acetylmuramoylalanine--D-glutamate ligase
MKFLLHGAGVEARAAAGALASRYQGELALFSDGQEELEGVRRLSLAEAERYVEGAVYLRSPGIPPHHPFVQLAQRQAAQVTTPTGFWFENEAPPSTIRVTGTKGKSTTVTLLSACLREAGVASGAYGNVGTPPFSLDVVRDTHPVVELSSYMMHDLPETDHLHVITSLYEDHLDWHGSKAAYHHAKLRPFLQASPAPGVAPRAVIESYGLTSRVKALEDLIGDDLQLGKYRINPGPAERGFGAGPLRQALRMAAGVASLLISPERAAEAASLVAASYEGLPSRQSLVPSPDGRLWVDDALATIPEAVISALDRFGGKAVTLLLGGADRGIDYSALEEALSGRDDVVSIGFGPVAERLGFLSRRVQTFDEALSEAAAATPTGGVVLFSPAAPSSPPHRDYKARSETFRAAAARAASPGG